MRINGYSFPDKTFKFEIIQFGNSAIYYRVKCHYIRKKYYLFGRLVRDYKWLIDNFDRDAQFAYLNSAESTINEFTVEEKSIFSVRRKLK